MIIPHADLKFALDTTVSIVRAIAATRAIFAVKGEERHAFWTTVHNGLFDTAVLDWCILFGSDNRDQQPLHWKNMFDPDEFRAGLLEHLHVSLDEWRTYRESLKIYRDQNAAHRDLNPQARFYPNMNHALESTIFYNEQLRRKLAEVDAVEARLSLRDEYKRRSEEFTDTARKAIAATL